MELWQLGALVGFGVTLIVFLVHLSGGSRKAILINNDMATGRYLIDFPLAEVQSVLRTTSGDAGFLLLSDGSTGLVHAVGDAFLTRHLTAGSIKSAQSVGPELSLAFNDFTFPAATYAFADEATASSLRQRLSP